MTDKPELLIWTCADQQYEMFVLPFAVCALVSNPDSVVAVGIESSSPLREVEAAALEHLSVMFPGRFTLRGLPPSEVPFATRRWLDAPTDLSHYTYICDVDILLTRDVLEVHRPLLERFGLPFSNSVRVGSDPPRLTGLHLVRSDVLARAQAGAADAVEPAELTTLNDEAVLHRLMANLDYDLTGLVGVPRPVPGFHLSLFSRFPFGRAIGSSAGQRRRPGWGRDPAPARDLLEASGIEESLSGSSRFVLAALRLYIAAREAEIDGDSIPLLTGGRILRERR